MSIFHRETPAAAPPAVAGGPPEVSQKRRLTHIAAGTVIRGEVTGSTELLVEGQVVGEVRVEAAVIVGAEGSVEGPVTAPVVRIGGRVAGNVQAADRVEVSPSGSLEGDVSAPRIVIAEGAFFKGSVEMKGDKGEKRAAPPKGRAEAEPKPSS
jgi:cytoskeletal protein CcmA (bactofilin family)